MIINTNKTGKERYLDYLASDHWQNLKAQKFLLSGRLCESCRTPFKVQVHHRNYRSWYDCTVDDLMVLCWKCHRQFHSSAKINGYTPKDFTIGETLSVIQGFKANNPHANIPRLVEKVFDKLKAHQFSKQALKKAAKQLAHLSRLKGVNNPKDRNGNPILNSSIPSTAQKRGDSMYIKIRGEGESGSVVGPATNASA